MRNSRVNREQEVSTNAALSKRESAESIASEPFSIGFFSLRRTAQLCSVAASANTFSLSLKRLGTMALDEASRKQRETFIQRAKKTGEHFVDSGDEGDHLYATV